jgi:hypothetical protein
VGDSHGFALKSKLCFLVSDPSGHSNSYQFTLSMAELTLKLTNGVMTLPTGPKDVQRGRVGKAVPSPAQCGVG